jgi:hypothetical protein
MPKALESGSRGRLGDPRREASTSLRQSYRNCRDLSRLSVKSVSNRLKIVSSVAILTQSGSMVRLLHANCVKRPRGGDAVRWAQCFQFFSAWTCWWGGATAFVAWRREGCPAGAVVGPGPKSSCGTPTAFVVVESNLSWSAKADHSAERDPT